MQTLNEIVQSLCSHFSQTERYCSQSNMAVFFKDLESFPSECC